MIGRVIYYQLVVMTTPKATPYKPTTPIKLENPTKFSFMRKFRPYSDAETSAKPTELAFSDQEKVESTFLQNLVEFANKPWQKLQSK